MQCLSLLLRHHYRHGGKGLTEEESARTKIGKFCPKIVVSAKERVAVQVWLRRRKWIQKERMSRRLKWWTQICILKDWALNLADELVTILNFWAALPVGRVSKGLCIARRATSETFASIHSLRKHCSLFPAVSDPSSILIPSLREKEE